jgi:hypothetical protein
MIGDICIRMYIVIYVKIRSTPLVLTAPYVWVYKHKDICPANGKRKLFCFPLYWKLQA